MSDVAYVKLSDDEHLREYARQLVRCESEVVAIALGRNQIGTHDEWLWPSKQEENFESARLQDMIYELVKNG